MEDNRRNRRKWLWLVGAASAGTLVAGCSRLQRKSESEEDRAGEKEEEISPAEDLMREHGLLNRLLLIYEEELRRIEAQGEVKPAVLSRAAGIIHRFIHDYHEKLEEDYLFPRFEKAGKLAALTSVLREQHSAGRRVTSEIERLANLRALKDPGDRKKLAQSLLQFVRMYRPHEAREDTVLFPALQTIVKPKEYDALGEKFEDIEHERFGADGFEKNVSEVEGLERELGIYALEQFTPAP